MRKLNLHCIVLLLFIGIFSAANAQVLIAGSNGGAITGTGMTGIPDAAVGGYGGNQGFMTFSARGGMRLPDLSAIQGSPFLHSMYTMAYIRLKNGFASHAQAKFSIFTNEVIFTNGSTEMALDSVDYMTYNVVNADGIPETVKLKSGFPPINKNNSSTIYQLLDSGINIQFLKHQSQQIEDVRPLGMPAYKEFRTSKEYFLHVNGEGMKKIKLDMKSIQQALPSYKDKIPEIVKEKNLDLRKESDVSILLQALQGTKGF
jgi:hypothetical protein